MILGLKSETIEGGIEEAELALEEGEEVISEEDVVNGNIHWRRSKVSQLISGMLKGCMTLFSKTLN